MWANWNFKKYFEYLQLVKDPQFKCNSSSDNMSKIGPETSVNHHELSVQVSRGSCIVFDYSLCQTFVLLEIDLFIIKQ